ncbi:M20/M25/M40 family metallo-hydrolase [Arenimonas sp.]|uniref:M20/M25/M40 family metallo-hydrolase n=1 Tax=Arenimonas sp. TaxID=1872635 RepID=UPI0039E5F925
MKALCAFLAVALFSFAADSASAAGNTSTRTHDHAGDLARLGLEQDPFAPVFIVSSEASFQTGIKLFARNPLRRTDSMGKPVVLSEIRAHQLGDVTRVIHERELRCGGYFAFASAKEAEHFLRNDRSRQAVQQAALIAYTVDNQATVNPWLPQVSATNIYSTINTLSGYKNRYYTSTYGKASAEWIRTTWQGLAGARTDVTSELFACATCSTQPSVILTVQGAELPNEVVVLGAHLDSIDVNAGGSNEQVAPGADDDASGVATLTEVIRVALASGWKPKRTVKFMGYAGEEVGLRGSNAIAQSFKTAGTNVVGVLQLDMTNYKSGGGVDMKLITDYSNAELKTYLTTLFDAYLAPLGLTRGTYTCGYGCSDHASWTSAGYPSAMFFEGGSASGYNPNIHSSADTLANMSSSAANSAKFAKLGLAFLGEMAKTQGTATPPPPPPNNVLQKGVPATGLSAATGASLNYTMVVPAGSQNLTFTTSGGTGDLDMYVQLGSAPTDTSYLCRPYKSGNAENCTFAAPTPGTYYIRLKAYAAFSGVQLVGNYAQCADCGNGPLVYTNATDFAIADNATVDSPIVVNNRSGNAPTNASISVTILHTYKGDLKVDLVAPDGTLYNIHNRSGGSADNVTGTFVKDLSSELLNGTWKLRVNDNGAGDVGKIDTWSITF